MRIGICAALALLSVSHAAAALDWRLGVAYVNGVEDVADLYEDNLRLAGRDASVDVKFPLGVFAGISYDWESNLRADAGLGPVFLIGGDISHVEVPLSATIGYAFNRLGTVSPYVRAGLIHHFVDGDQYSGSSPGLLIAAGIDFTHFGFEIASDGSEVEFDRLTCTAPASCTLGTTKLKTYDLIASFYWRFR